MKPPGRCWAWAITCPGIVEPAAAAPFATPALNWRRVSFKCLLLMADLPIACARTSRTLLLRPRAEIGSLKSGELLVLKWGGPGDLQWLREAEGRRCRHSPQR